MTKITDDIFENYSVYPLIFIHRKTNEAICEKCARAMNFNELKENFVFDVFIQDFDEQWALCMKCNGRIDYTAVDIIEAFEHLHSPATKEVETHPEGRTSKEMKEHV